jgi:hypothetical protein
MRRAVAKSIIGDIPRETLKWPAAACHKAISGQGEAASASENRVNASGAFAM